MKTVSVYGLGRVGLVTAVCLAKRGYFVSGVDADPIRMRTIQRGESPFSEPRLKEYLKEVCGRDFVTDATGETMADVMFVTVGTPSTKRGVDVSFVKAVAKQIGQLLKKTDRRPLIVVKSTVPPSTTRNVVKPIIETASGKLETRDEFRLCANPEFLREGSAINDTENPDRIIIGGGIRSIMELKAFYSEFYRDPDLEIVGTSYENAELIKYANNAFLATKISFINSLANIAERIPHSNIQTIAEGIGLDDRIGRKFLNAGLGWGGSCLPKDLQALIALSRRVGYTPWLLEATVRVNRAQWRRGLQLAQRHLGSFRKKRFAILGLAFKPETDDMREAISKPIVEMLLARGGSVAVFDPAAMEEAHAVFGRKVTYANNALECLSRADCCLVLTEWDEFKKLSVSVFVERMRKPLVIDGRGIYDAIPFRQAGANLVSIGVGPDQAENRCRSEI